MKSFMLKLSLGLLSVLLLTTSCGEDYKQSSFDLGQVTTTATVKGTFFYPAGLRFNSSTGAYEEIIAYPEGKRIFLDLDLTSLGGTGVRTYQTTIGKDGSYSFIVPVATVGSDITIRVEDFEAEYSTINSDIIGKVENDKIIKKKVVYTCDPVSKTIRPFTINNYNDYYLSEGIQTSIDMKEIGSISGKMKVCYSGTYGDFSDIEADSKVVMVRVSYTEPYIQRLYTTRTNSRGEFTVKIPLNKKISTVKVLAYGEKYTGTFRYHESVGSSMLDGYYYDGRLLTEDNISFDLNVTSGVELSKTIKMIFSPYAGQAVTNSYFLTNWGSWLLNN